MCINKPELNFALKLKGDILLLELTPSNMYEWIFCSFAGFVRLIVWWLQVLQIWILTVGSMQQSVVWTFVGSVTAMKQSMHSRRPSMLWAHVSCQLIMASNCESRVQCGYNNHQSNTQPAITNTFCGCQKFASKICWKTAPLRVNYFQTKCN